MMWSDFDSEVGQFWYTKGYSSCCKIFCGHCIFVQTDDDDETTDTLKPYKKDLEYLDDHFQLIVTKLKVKGMDARIEMEEHYDDGYRQNQRYQRQKVCLCECVCGVSVWFVCVCVCGVCVCLCECQVNKNGVCHILIQREALTKAKVQEKKCAKRLAVSVYDK